MRLFRPISWLLLGLIIPAAVFSQTAPSVRSDFAAADAGSPELTINARVVSLSPELALANYERGLKQQAAILAGYTATTTIDAELPDSEQKAELELTRHYLAPGVLEFTPLRSSGDKFVKSNIIVRLLESEVEHVRKREQAQTAIDAVNYKFKYKGTALINGVSAHVFEIKPRQKRVGLFKGRIYVDSANARLLRAEGRLVKSPSFFIKKIDFVEDYASVDGFTLLTHLHSEAETRLVGRTVIDISHRDYRPELVSGSALRTDIAAGSDGSN